MIINNKHINKSFKVIKYKRLIKVYKSEMTGGFTFGLVIGLIYFFNLLDIVVWTK